MLHCFPPPFLHFFLLALPQLCLRDLVPAAHGERHPCAMSSMDAMIGQRSHERAVSLLSRAVEALRPGLVLLGGPAPREAVGVLLRAGAVLVPRCSEAELRLAAEASGV